ncbi:MAG: hypothetical protein JNG84_06320 [Archangium sp.]|nr:hypothetical protein [Archangium sp.]
MNIKPPLGSKTSSASARPAQSVRAEPEVPPTSTDQAPTKPLATSWLAPSTGQPPVRASDGFETSAAAATAAVELPPPWKETDWHIPGLDELFTRALDYPNKTIFLDTKIPTKNPTVARRMAQQYMEAFRAFPSMKDRAFISVPDAKTLAIIKDEFAKAPDFQSFKNFCLDKEELNKMKGDVRALADPLTGAGDNAFIAVGDPKNPLGKGDFDDLKAVVAKTLTQTRDPASPHSGKKLSVWTINDPKKMKEIAKLNPDFILTDDPAMLKAVLDELYAPGEKRPGIMCHRGGPAGYAPMNTMPMLDEGFREGDAIEIDVCSTKDGAILFHDNEPANIVTNLHNFGEDEKNFRLKMPNLFTKARGKRVDQLSMAEVRKAYEYDETKQRKTKVGKALNKVGRVAGTVGGWALTNVQKVGR